MLPIVIILSVSSVVVAAINVSCCIVIVYNKKMHVTSHKTVLSLLIGHSIQGLFVILLKEVASIKELQFAIYSDFPISLPITRVV